MGARALDAARGPSTRRAPNGKLGAGGSARPDAPANTYAAIPTAAQFRGRYRRRARAAAVGRAQTEGT